MVRYKLQVFHLLVLVGYTIGSSAAQSCYASQRGHLAGNVTLGFLFSYRGYDPATQKCNNDVPNLENIQLIEAASMILQRAGVPGIAFGLDSWDTCSSSHAAVEASMAYLADQFDDSNQDTLTDPCSSTVSKPGIVAGLENGGQGETVSWLMNEARVPVISFGASQPSLTEDGQFPYFLRTIPNDDFQSVGLVLLLQRMNWNYVTTITLDTVEDQAALRSFQRAANRHSICITSPQQFSSNSSNEDMDQLLSGITSNAYARVAVVFSSRTEKLAAAVLRAENSASALQFVLGHRATLAPVSGASALPGALGFRLPSPPTDEFDAYFRNLTPDTVDPVRNPWFRDYWQRKYRCNLPGSGSYSQNCSSIQTILHEHSYVRHPYVPSVIDAVLAFTTNIQTFYNVSCSVIGQSGSCDSDQSQQWLSLIKNVNFTKDNGQHFAFHQSGDTYYNRLDIVNYKMNGAGNFQLEPLGSFERGELSLNVSQLELVSSGGVSPVRSECNPPCVDLACGDTSGPMVYIPGDVILGGFFSVHNWNDSQSSCGAMDKSGVRRLEAMMYALDKINNDTTILPGIKLGMDGFDTCGHPDRAGHQALQLVSQSQFGQSGSGQRPKPGGLLEHVYGIIGPNGDEECQLVNGVLNVYDTPMISYAATAQTLSNSAVYTNFARTVFPDSTAGYALLQAMLAKGWRYAQALNSNTASGRLLSAVLQQTGTRIGVCLTTSQIIPPADNRDQMDEVFQNLLTRSSAKVVVITATNADMRVILGEFQRRNLFDQFYLILASEWSTDLSLQSDFAAIAPGITFLSEGKRSYPEFKEYFSRLKPGTNLRNPWFAEYWADRFQCNYPGTQSAYAEDCSGFESLTPDDGEDMRIAQTVDAVYAMARAISDLHARYCPGELHVCPAMITATGEELFQLLTVPFTNRFTSVNDGYIVAMNIYGDVAPDYEIYNVQTMPDGTLIDVKVGVYQNYNFRAVDGTDITLYTKVNDTFVEVADAKSVCEGRCDDCKTNERVQTAEVSGGDVWIGGLFELHEPTSDNLQCKDQLIPYNVQLLEAFLFAVEQVNLNSAILPELKLGAIGFDSCGSADRARREVLNFVSGAVDYRSGYLQTRASVVGIIGGQTSDTTVTVAEALTPLGINQVSYSATTSELDNSGKFPYFLRTVPSDNMQARAIVDLLQAANWQYVSVVYSDNLYGTDLWKGVQQNLARTSVCVAMSLRLLPTYTSRDYEMIVRQLQTNPYAQTVLLLTSDIDTRRVLEAAERISVTDLQWIGTDAWGDRDYVIEHAQVTSRGALTLRFQKAPMIQAFKDYIIRLQVYANRRNPWWITYWEDTFQCNTFGSTRYNVSCPWQLNLESVYMQETEVAYIIDAVQLFATGLHNAMQEICPEITRYICDDLASHPDILHRYVREATITRLDGSVFKLDENGNGAPFFDVLHIEANDTGVGNSYMKVGNWTPERLTLNSAPSVGPTKCLGRCAECNRVEENPYVRVPAPIQILGLFDLHASGDHLAECGELRDAGMVNLEAMLYAIDRINADPMMLNGVAVGATAFDTCSRGSRGVRDLSSVFSGSRSLQEDSIHNVWSLIGGVVGGESDQVTLTTASLTKQYKYAQVSYGAGTTDENFSNLLQVGPTVDNQVSAVMQLLEYFQWQYASLISSSTEYRVQQRDTFIREADRRGLCIGTQAAIGQADIPALLQSIYETTDLNVVVLFTDKEDTLQLMEAVERQNRARHLQWVIAFSGLEENELSGSSYLGALSITSPPKRVPGFEEYFSSLTALSNQRNPWFQEFIGYKYNCSVNPAGHFSEECSRFENASLQVTRGSYALSANVINAVYAIAYGLDDLRDRRCGSTPGLCAAFVGLSAEELQQGIKESSFTGEDGSKVNFENGASVERFIIWNYKQINNSNQFGMVGSWMSGNISIENGRVDLLNPQGQPVTTPVSSQCPGSSPQPSLPTTTPVSSTARGTTVATNKITMTTKSATTAKATTATESPETIHTTTKSQSGTTQPLVGVSNLTSSWFTILQIIAVIGIILSLALIFMNACRWKRPVTEAMSPFLCVMLLVGIVLAYLLVPIYAAPPSVVTCGIRRVWPGIAFAFCQIAIFLMAVRLCWLSMQVHVISGKMSMSLMNVSGQAAAFFILMALEVVIVAEWLILQPPELMASDAPNAFNGNGSVTAVCANGASISASLSYVHALIVMAFFPILLTWRKKNMVSLVELITLQLMNAGSLILMIAWIVVESLIAPNDRSVGVAVIATIKATLLLLQSLPRARRVLFKRGSFDDSSRVQLAESRGSIPEYPAAEDMNDDVSLRGSQIELIEAALTDKK
ncbi:uncharacterized protein LOC110973163 [Acanthaster planci]|uniref:Uncharacterized protein LOC110973163 n=1 Tax=Acanthaster planci TaxID=133434 RepID=A0A8B7XHQ2_ACAPL|nr:uncharacterized protein LOC110973163 [Acanthaster planci]XP_022079455.1 uncharacterized protein LOC110973163 [Acanthaster planci]